MENLQWILSLAGAVLALASAAVGFLVKLVKAIREKDAEKVKNLLSEAAREAVAFAETVKGVSGDTKKTIALTRINQKLIESGAKYDEEAASAAVESVISLSKEVNAVTGRGDKFAGVGAAAPYGSARPGRDDRSEER